MNQVHQFRQPAVPRRRKWVVPLIVIFVILLSAGTLVRFYTDLLWFGELKLGSVFWTMFRSRMALGIAGGVISGLLIFINLEVARRAGPRGRAGVAVDPMAQYRQAVQPYVRWANVGVSVLVGLLTGASTAATWEKFQLWRHAKTFGTSDPLFGKDIGFFVFHLPFQRVVLSSLIGMFVAALFVTGVAHLLNGSIEPQGNRIVVHPIVKVHVSVILGCIAVLKAWGYRLAAYELVFSPRGTTTGASYTDVKVQLPAFKVLFFVAIVTALVFFVNMRFRGWLLPVAAIALWMVSSVVIGGVVPAAIQRFKVEPNEAQFERPYIDRNIKATRAAFGLDNFNVSEFAAEPNLDAAKLADNQATIDNMRLWDPATLLQSYKRLQSIRGYYDFKDVDVDRYMIDGKPRQIMLAPREVQPDQIDERARNWINTRLTYTHGYGAVAAPTNAVTPEGHPQLIMQDLPPVGAAELAPKDPTRWGVYFGEQMADYSVVNTGQKEIEYATAESTESTVYKGDGGVALSGPLRRVAFGLRFRDYNLALSPLIKPQSRILMRRDIRERVATAAPFLRYDHDPYVVVTGRGMFWIQDAYTATDRYPYSQELPLESIFQGSHTGTVNYIRNSVKVVIDAYDGSMRFYVTGSPEVDPIIEAYRDVFPGMFTSIDQMPDDLRSHVRYPEDLFLVQSWQYRQYHITDPGQMYSREDVWDFPADPTQSSDTNKIAMQPYYLLMKLPGEQKAEFILMLPFTPRTKQNLNGWVAARSDPDHYGELVAFTFPRGRAIEGPELVASRVEQDAVVSQQFKLWEGAGSRVARGNLFVIPIGTSLLYVQPIYLQAEAAAVPELRKVIVYYNGHVGFESTLDASMQKALAGQASSVEPTSPPPGPAPGPAPAGDLQALLAQAAQHFAAADEALRRGDLAAYQRENQAAREAIEAARR